MDTIKTIDLWTEQMPNHIECISGAFIDGFENGNIPFDRYKVIRNCNCIISCNQEDLDISNKHNAIVFYKGNVPVRLMVVNGETKLDECIEIALNQAFESSILRNAFVSLEIKRSDVDLREQPIYNGSDRKKEVDVGSCDRPSLLDSMLEGSYTQSDTNYGKSNNDKSYQFRSNIYIGYSLKTDTEAFVVEHHCAFLNDNKTRIIPLQDNSLLNIEIINQQYYQDDNPLRRK